LAVRGSRPCEWIGQRVAALGAMGRLGAGAVLVQLLEADGDAEVTAAIAAGRKLNEWQVWGITQSFQQYRDSSGPLTRTQCR
jgi:hypothetical protein